jgi:hypothetical protein
MRPTIDCDLHGRDIRLSKLGVFFASQTPSHVIENRAFLEEFFLHQS